MLVTELVASSGTWPKTTRGAPVREPLNVIGQRDGPLALVAVG
jgi:hypothetical protein